MKHLKQRLEDENLKDLLEGPDRWQYLLKMIDLIGDAYVKMLDVRNWRVSQYVYGISDMGVIFEVTSKGETPEEAVLDHWGLLTKPDYYYCVNAIDYYKWNSLRLGWERYQREHTYAPFARVL